MLHATGTALLGVLLLAVLAAGQAVMRSRWRAVVPNAVVSAAVLPPCARGLAAALPALRAQRLVYCEKIGEREALNGISAKF